MNGALATKSPSGAKSAQEKSRRSLMFVLIEVCWRLLPIASATLIKRFAKRVKIIGSGLFVGIAGAMVRKRSMMRIFRFQHKTKSPLVRSACQFRCSESNVYQATLKKEEKYIGKIFGKLSGHKAPRKTTRIKNS